MTTDPTTRASLVAEIEVWPLGFYAPGNYLCTCAKCGLVHQADKRARHCLTCAVSSAKAQIIADAAYIAELEARVRELETVAHELLQVQDGVPMFGIEAERRADNARRALNKERACCRKCGAEMRPGIAMGQTYTAGVPDFPGDDYSSTFSAGGPGRVMECLKCPECGWSVEKADE